MTEHIPNEILAEILYHTVAIPTKTFEAWNTPSSFAGGPRSTVTNILLVSKRWNDLAEPALYESAILRTKAQVRGLARSTSKNFEKGVKRASRLRHLRIEGGYSNSFNQLLGVAPGIVTLFLGFDVSLDDSFAGLKRALQRINPSRLFLQSTPGGHATAQNTQSLYTAVGVAFPSWTNLKRIDTSPLFGFWGPMVPPLKELPALETISMTNHTAIHNIQHITLEFIVENPSVRVIQIRDGVKWLAWKGPRPNFPREKFVLGEGKNMVSWADFPLPTASPAAPIVQLPELPDQIWTRILGFATHVHGYNYLDWYDERTKLSKEAKVNTTRRHVLLVSRRFYRLGLPHMYSIPHLPTRAVDRFTARVQASPELAKLVRALSIAEEVMTLPFGVTKQISASLTNLVRASNFLLLLDLDERIPAGATSPLEYVVQTLFTFEVSALPLAPRNFLKFPHLRELILRGGRGTELDDVHPDVLLQLESLGLIEAGPDMFRLFSSMSLPRLRELKFSFELCEDARGFLEVHGTKLDILSLQGLEADRADSHQLLSLCPNITELRLVNLYLPNKLPFVEESARHTALRRVVCPQFTIGSPGRQQEEWKRWGIFVGFLKVFKHKLPVLEEFRIHNLKWPMHESDYSHSPFTHIALDLHELNIALADKDGTRWTRLVPTRYPPLGRLRA